MRSPIYEGPLRGTKAQQYLHRARQFRQAAIDLPCYSNSEQNWPRYALLTHSLELALKAFAFHSVADSPIANEPKQHDLVGWYELAICYRLEGDRAISEGVGFLNELHKTHFTRYPTELPGPIPNLEAIADQTVDVLITKFTEVVNPR
jgi:hypothetical protein